MLRRNGPVVKSVGSFMRLEGSLWWERFVKEVSLESWQTTSFHIQVMRCCTTSSALTTKLPGSRATPSLATSWDCACGLENERDFPDSWTQLTSTRSKGMWGTHQLYLFRTKLAVVRIPYIASCICKRLVNHVNHAGTWHSEKLLIWASKWLWHVTISDHLKDCAHALEYEYAFKLLSGQPACWLSLFSVLLTKSLIFLWIQTAHTDLISVNRFSFQMQEFSWLCCFFNFVCRADNVQNFFLTINQVIFLCFWKMYDCAIAVCCF